MSDDGTFDQAKGRTKQAAGDLTGDDETHREGKVDEKSGDVKEKASDAGDKVSEGVSNATDKVKDAFKSDN